MLQLTPLDQNVPIVQQLGADVSPVVLEQGNCHQRTALCLTNPV